MERLRCESGIFMYLIFFKVFSIAWNCGEAVFQYLDLFGKNISLHHLFFFNINAISHQIVEPNTQTSCRRDILQEK